MIIKIARTKWKNVGSSRASSLRTACATHHLKHVSDGVVNIAVRFSVKESRREIKKHKSSSSFGQ